MLCFTLKNEGRAIAVALDDAGMKTLAMAFEQAKAQGHVHLRGASCGGEELVETSPWGEAAICEVIITDASE